MAKDTEHGGGRRRGFGALAAVLVVLFVASGAAAQNGELHPTDRQALETLYHETDGPNWQICSDLDDFLDPFRAFSCGSFGVYVRASEQTGRVLKLGLDSNNLSGSIPAELGNLTSLEDLSLDDNNLSGPIPAELGNLTSLENLHIPRNNLSGSIPAELGNLTSLENLWLEYNNLSGPIPAELGNLTSLESLWLGDTFFQSTAGNNLSGPIPAELGHGLVNIHSVFLDGDTGLCLPRDFPRDSVFYLVGVFPLSLTGQGIPDCDDAEPVDPGSPDRDALMALYNATDGPNWTNNTNWGTDEPLDSWDGVVATVIDGEERVTQLSLWRENLTGPLPPQLGSLTKLRSLNLAGNSLTGHIPSGLGALLDLEDLKLDLNDFTGPIPPSLGLLSNLKAIDLSNNGLDGAVPAALGNLSKLETLDLMSNRLTGRIPRTFLNIRPFVFLALTIDFNDGLCLPQDAEFDAWLDEHVHFSGDRCAPAAVVAKPPDEVQANVNAAIIVATDGAGLHTGGVSASVPLDDLFTLPEPAALGFSYTGYTFAAESSSTAVLDVVIGEGLDRAQGPAVVLIPGATAGSASVTVWARTEGVAEVIATVTFDVEVQAAVPALPLLAIFGGVLGLLAAGLVRLRRRRAWEACA